MLRHRIIPILLLKNGRMVKTIRFDKYRDVGNPITTARIYDAQRADELVFLDIEASDENRGFLTDTLRQVSRECFMPFGAGGGIKTIADIKMLLASGADKVVVNTAAFDRPDFIPEAAAVFGSSTIVASIDVRNKPDGKYEVYVQGGNRATGLDPIAYVKKMEALGAGEIILMSIDREGTMTGPDILLIRSVADAVAIPIIAGGGVATIDDFRRIYDDGHASAAAAGSIFHFTDQSIIKTRTHLANQGVHLRP